MMKLYLVMFNMRVPNEKRFLNVFTDTPLYDEDFRIFTSEEKAHEYIQSILFFDENYTYANIVEVDCSIEDSSIARLNTLNPYEIVLEKH